jgi:hypothetical protein
MVVCFNQKVIDDEMKDLKVNTEMQVLNHFSQFLLLQLSLLTKLADLNVHKKTDGRQKWTFLQPYFFLILRRNEAERKHSAKKKSSNYNTFFTAYSFGMHATKGSTNFSISKKNYNPSHPSLPKK